MNDEMSLALQRDKILNSLCYNLFEYFLVPQEELDALKNTYLKGLKGIDPKQFQKIKQAIQVSF